MSPFARLQTLAEHGRKAEALCADHDPKDSVAHLTPEKRAGWRRLLSSVATTEGTEETLMIPLRQAYGAQPEIETYLETHQRDEARHSALLQKYLLNTFDYVKRAPTFSDRVVYEGIFPWLGKLFLRKPTYGLAMLYFIETYGIYFYQTFRELAVADGLAQLDGFLAQFEKDERRHLAGLKAVIEATYEKRPSWVDRKAIAGCLYLMALDVSLSWWALHNREVKRHGEAIGLDPRQLALAAQNAIRRTIALFSEGPKHAV